MKISRQLKRPRSLHVHSLLWMVMAASVQGGSAALGCAGADWGRSAERAVLERLTTGRFPGMAVVERVGRWRFDSLAIQPDLPLAAELRASGRHKQSGESSAFEFRIASGSWAATRILSPGEDVQAFFWDEAREYRIRSGPLGRVGPEDRRDANRFHVVVVNHADIRTSPFELHMLGYLLLAEGFPGDRTRVGGHDSLLSLLDSASLQRVKLPTSPELRRWVGSHESRGRMYSIVRDFELEFRVDDDDAFSVNSFKMSYTARNHAGDLLRRFSDLWLRFGDGWNADQSARDRDLQALATHYDEDGAVLYSMYSEYRLRAGSDADADLSLAEFLETTTRGGTEDEAVIEVLDRALGLQYELGERRVRCDGRIIELDRSIDRILTPASWVRLVAATNRDEGMP